MLNLPQVTLISLTNRNFEEHKAALEKASEGIQWGARKIIWDEDIKDIDDWNYKIVYELHRYVQTDFALLFHGDGYPIRPEAWRDEFLDYDFIGAPWPLPQDNYSYRDQDGRIIRVGNSVSLRSKRLLEIPQKHGIPWRSYFGYTNEDGFICVHQRKFLEEQGIKFAPLEVAKYFSKEHDIPENYGIETFAFHQVDL